MFLSRRSVYILASMLVGDRCFGILNAAIEANEIPPACSTEECCPSPHASLLYTSSRSREQRQQENMKNKQPSHSDAAKLEKRQSKRRPPPQQLWCEMFYWLGWRIKGKCRDQ